MAVPLICRYCSSSIKKILCFNMKSTNVGMSLINVWSVVFIVRNERHASTPPECGMLVCREFTSILTSKESGVTKWVMSFSLQIKSVVSFRKLCILSKTFSKMESTYPEMCSVNVPLQETIGLYGGLISWLLATCVICSVFVSALIKWEWLYLEEMSYLSI